MPELPEVETTRRGIQPHLLNETVSHILVRNSRLRWPVSPYISLLKNLPIHSVKRRAKYLLLQLDGGWIIVHLGMSGHLRILNESTSPGKHDHIDLILTNGNVLRYNDPRRFGAWLWSEDPFSLPLLAQLGPEPLTEEFNADYLFKQSRQRSTTLKPWLMNSKVVVGIGNIYANEALFNAKILPNRPAMSLNRHEAGVLVDAIKIILAKAIDQGGTTLRNFQQSDGKPGYFAQILQVYGRAGDACRCCGLLLRSEKLAQRSTFWCEACQK